MNITNVDKNFEVKKAIENDIVWIDAKDERFSLHGGFYSKEEGIYTRLPSDVAEATSGGVSVLSKHTSGLRLRFSTNSSYVAIKCFFSRPWLMQHMPLSGSAGFGLTVNGKSVSPFMVSYDDAVNSVDEVSQFDGIFYINSNDFNDIEIYFPLYNGVKELFIGVKDGSKINGYSKPYSFDKPLLFYGSSITQGGCASKPDNSYTAIVAKKLNVDFINLGFSGCAKGEQAISDYISTLDPLVFIYDYDHNAPSVEELINTHYPLYKNFRTSHPKTPVIFISKPDIHKDCYEDNIKRREVIYKNFLKAQNEGDENVYFIDGESLFGYDDWDLCTVDGTHPNDLGFYRMAQTILSILNTILK